MYRTRQTFVPDGPDDANVKYFVECLMCLMKVKTNGIVKCLLCGKSGTRHKRSKGKKKIFHILINLLLITFFSFKLS